MISTVSQGGIQAAVGQFLIVKQSFTSDTMLTGEVLKFHPLIWDDGSTPLSPAYQILYPPAAGTYDFTNLSGKNYRAELQVIDANNFKVLFYFIVPMSSGNFTADLGMYVKAGSDSAKALVPVTVSRLCNDAVDFIESGFTPGVDLPVQFKVPGTSNHNFYVGLVKLDAINNSISIVPGYYSNYALINNGAVQVDDLPYSCFTSGFGFQEQMGVSTGGVTIAGSCLQSNSSYKVLVVYNKDGVWQSCLSPEIVATATNAPITPTGTFTSTDDFGNSGGQCLTGLSSDVAVDLCFDFDTADFDSKLTAAGLSGTWSDYYVSAKAFYSTGATSVSGTPLTLTGTAPNFCVNDFKYDDGGHVFVVIQLRFDYADHTDFVNVPFDLTYNASTIPFPVSVNGGVGEMCDGDTYAIDQSLPDCTILQSIDGSDWSENTIITGTAIDLAQIPLNGVACFKAVCSDGPDDGCQCPCPDTTFTIHQYTDAVGDLIVEISGSGSVSGTIDGVAFSQSLPATIGTFFDSIVINNITIVDGDCTYVDNTVRTYPQNKCYSYDIYNEGSVTYWATYRRCRGTQIVTVNVAPGEHLVVCAALNSIELESPLLMSITLLGACVAIDTTATINLSTDDTYPCTGCDEGEEEECENYASISYECDEETGTVTITQNTNLMSPVESQEFMCSTDGGLTFTPCPGTITGEENIFVTLDIVFSDNCPALHVEQTIYCKKDVPCQNTREIELEYVSDTLVITLTDSFDSTALTDKLYVSTDGGANFTTYNPASSYTPISLNGDEKIVVYTETVFEDGCPDLKVTKTLDLTTSTGDCMGYSGYNLSVVYDENTGLYTVTKTGSESGLSVNELLWTLDGGNPLNGSGVPYNVPVQGQGLFIVRWRIKKQNCPEYILDAVAWGQPCTKFCEDINLTIPPIEVLLPTQPIEVCLVECCEGVTLTITCVNKVLTVAGAPAGATITWTGPGGFTGSGTSVTITDEGTYFVSVVDNSTSPPCTSTASYTFDMPNAGAPAGNPIIIT